VEKCHHAIISNVVGVAVVVVVIVVIVVADARCFVATAATERRSPNNLYVLLQRFIIVLCG